MAKFYSVSDYLPKGVMSGSGTTEDEATDKGTDSAPQSIGGDSGDATEGDGGDAGDALRTGTSDVADAGSGDVPATPTAKKPTKRA